MPLGINLLLVTVGCLHTSTIMISKLTVGVAIAQTSLAEILLRLDVGLIGIINSFLHSDKNDVQLDYRELADLSDRSRIDTCRTLRQLFRRLTHLNQPKAIQCRESAGLREEHETKNYDDRRSRVKDRARPTKIRGPVLAQVVIQDSSKQPQIAMVRPSERRKHSRSSSGAGSASDFSLSKSRSNVKSTSAASTPPPQYPATTNHPGERRPHRKQSAANITSKSSAVKGDKIRATKSTPRLEATLQEPFDPVPPLPPMPHTAPLPAATSTSALGLPRHRRPTPTFYSVATDSTKLGEIPLHKWTTPVDFDEMSMLNGEAYRNGWPNDHANGESRTRRAGLFGLFRRRTE